ncbi:exported hypothetical protein [Candidatus Sulfopaludibacter sp. SbA3]|nr:exported hypothetical protein [Candidatus Sulfopaludibacter sp. SbA3]
MKRQLLRFAPWLALMALGIVAAPAPQERHPHIRAALKELRAAREELQSAERDFCGHRAAAVKSADTAMRQLQQALECDR